MAQPTLPEKGDSFEQQTWARMKDYFGRYELFWQLHIYPLRGKDTIHLRDGVHEDLELLAMHHYATYVNLVRAEQKIREKAYQLRFFDEIYANLQRSREMAAQVVTIFCAIYQKCVHNRAKINDSQLLRMEKRLSDYRNLIHRPLFGYILSSDGRIRIPKPKYIEKYRLWTRIVYDSKPQDFEDVEVQLCNDFSSLCSVLEDAWKQMIMASKILCANHQYINLQQSGDKSHRPSFRVPPASGGMVEDTSD